MLSVSDLNEKAKALLEANIGFVEVSGEISRLTKHGSGHWYFTLKDEKSAISTVMYRLNNTKLRFEVKDGMSVVIYGKISIYGPSGSYQLIAQTLNVSGEGELEVAFKQLKEKLAKEGLFEPSYKKQLPLFAKRIALVTSATSAALQDMLRITQSRWKASKIFIFDALTQGANAPASLINALQKADNFGVDVIVLARGGGSREDLWCFNDENLARQIFACKTPIISAIGHEIDYVISDFVADYRAPTPSAAMAELLPDENAIFQYLDELDDKFDKNIKQKIETLSYKLNMLGSKFSPMALKARIDLVVNETKVLGERLDIALKNKFTKLKLHLDRLQIAFDAKAKFFESTKDLAQIHINGKNADLMELKIGDEISIIKQDGIRNAVITK
ncbi:MAG: exodeoxyribonuclease VII large subunit [Campylobacter sp.]|nr:exodeoxyribonuclease VII large subunit [Campylobacter sp.]